MVETHDRASLLFLYICGMKILVCDIIDQLGEDFIAKCKEIMPEWRKEQMLKIKHLKGRVQCALGWLMVKPNDNWVYNEHGKPYFEGRKDLFFSISHCASAVAVVIDDEEVGIDIEEVSRYKERLVDYVANDEEKSVIGNVEDFIELWTKKEAVFKMLGTGITHDIKDVLKNNRDVNVYSKKIGEKYLSVATKKMKTCEDIGVEMVKIEELIRLFG